MLGLTNAVLNAVEKTICPTTNRKQLRLTQMPLEHRFVDEGTVGEAPMKGSSIQDLLCVYG